MFTKTKKWLHGKKTYLVATAAICTAVVAWSGGNIDLLELAKAVFAAFGVSALRAGVANDN